MVTEGGCRKRHDFGRLHFSYCWMHSKPFLPNHHCKTCCGIVCWLNTLVAYLAKAKQHACKHNTWCILSSIHCKMFTLDYHNIQPNTIRSDTTYWVTSQLGHDQPRFPLQIEQAQCVTNTKHNWPPQMKHGDGSAHDADQIRCVYRVCKVCNERWIFTCPVYGTWLTLPIHETKTVLGAAAHLHTYCGRLKTLTHQPFSPTQPNQHCMATSFCCKGLFCLPCTPHVAYTLNQSSTNPSNPKTCLLAWHLCSCDLNLSSSQID